MATLSIFSVSYLLYFLVGVNFALQNCKILDTMEILVSSLQNAENSSHERGRHSSSPGKENCNASRKRKHSVTDKDDTGSKKLHMSTEGSNNEDKFWIPWRY
ncbi:hypothetical protein AVEN_238242-1 [Araneus ventricosus]|uniref:Uncharacterized protein n=1 Tax=Araneus ventricosus TaxID=182803 RepID=A0A4Y2N5H6_ARAVE|nr:hypothetical protein AVEN_238242-1 [Araneus ventricosus]